MVAIIYAIIFLVVCLSADKAFVMPHFLKAQIVLILLCLATGKIVFDLVYVMRSSKMSLKSKKI